MWNRDTITPTFRTLACALSAVLVIGCGSDDDSTGPEPVASAVTTVSVAEATAALIGGTQHTIGTIATGAAPVAPFFYLYTPADYDANAADGYPVVTLLHGFGEDMNTWTDGVQIQALLDGMIDAGTIDPMIVVMPNGVGGVIGSFYADSPVFGGYASYIEGIITQVEGDYNSNGKRAIGGISMGGFGAMHLALGGGGFGLTYDGVISHSGPLSIESLLNPDPFYGGLDFPQLLLYEASTAAGLGLIEGLASGCTNVLGADFGLSAAILNLIGDSVNAAFTTFTFGGAAAFSPHYGAPGLGEYDMLFDLDGDPCNNGQYPIAPANADSSEWVGVNFPIQADGQLNGPAWDAWVAADPLGRVGNLPMGTQVFVDCGNMDELGLADDNADFAAEAAGTWGDDFTYETFDGGHSDMLADRLAVSLAWLNSVLAGG